MRLIPVPILALVLLSGCGSRTAVSERVDTAPHLSPMANASPVDAERQWRQELARHDAAGGDVLAAAACRDQLARICADAGRWSEAEHLLREALTARRRRLPDGHDDLAANAAMLADVLRIQGALAEAESLYRSALTIWKKPGREVDINAIAAHHGLAQVCVGRDEVVEANVQLVTTLSLIESGQGPTASALVPVLAELAELRFRSNDLVGADAALTRAVAIAEHEPDVAMLADLLEPLAGVQVARHEFAAAQDTLTRALALHARPGGNARRLGAVLAQSAEAYRQAGDGVAAEAGWRRALTQWESIGGSDQPEVAAVLDGLAATLSAAGNHSEAEQASARALAILERRYGMDHVELLPVLGNRVLVLAAAATWTEAAATDERRIALLERGGSDRPEFVRALSECSALYAQAGDRDRALIHSRRALAIVERLLPQDDPDVAIARANCAALTAKP